MTGRPVGVRDHILVGPPEQVWTALRTAEAAGVLAGRARLRTRRDGQFAVHIQLRPPPLAALPGPAVAGESPKQAPTRPRRRPHRLIVIAAVAVVTLTAVGVAVVWLAQTILQHVPILIGGLAVLGAVALGFARRGGGRHCPGCRG